MASRLKALGRPFTSNHESGGAQPRNTRAYAPQRHPAHIQHKTCALFLKLYLRYLCVITLLLHAQRIELDSRRILVQRSNKEHVPVQLICGLYKLA